MQVRIREALEMGSHARAIAAVSVSLMILALVFAGSARTAPVGFDPTVKLETSTTRATAHPDARITIDNSASDEDLKDLTIDLPKGFLGSLDAAIPCSASEAVQDDPDCPASAKVGTVSNEATVDDSEVKLSGTVYLTEAINSNPDPAGLLIVVPAKIGGVDMGNVVVRARVQIRYGALPGGAPTTAAGPIEGIRTIVTDVPRSITDDKGRTVSFHLQKLMVDLRSNQVAPRKPLLTNASTCSITQLLVDATSYDATNVQRSDDYEIDGCSTVKYEDPSMSFDASTTTAGADIGFTAEVGMPEDQAASRAIQIKLPPMIGPQTASFGDTTLDQCPVTSFAVSASANVFDPATCPAQAKVGKAEIRTPLLPDPVIGDVWLISKSPIPNLGIYVDETTDDGSPDTNPKGVRLGIAGASSTPASATTCGSFLSSCPTNLTVTFTSLPDAPITSVKLHVDGPSRTGSSGPLGGKILKLAGAADSVCQADDDLTGLFGSHAAPTTLAYSVATVSATGCNSRDVSMSGSPYGGATGSTTPTLPFTYGGAGTTDCRVDNGSFTSCTAPSFTSSTLARGVHRAWVYDSAADLDTWRAFVVSPSAGDTTAPTTTITSGPSGSTGDDTPSWDFSSNESSQFQCSIDSGAFLPCTSGAPSATTGSFTQADAFVAGSTHDFAVRAQDAAGNVGPADTATFTVDIPFSPAFSYSLSTTQARAHPDLDITITNRSHEDIKDLSFGLPDGFFGGLTGVGVLCPLANADAGTCPATSQVGTVATEAAIDESTVRISGNVYLTEPRDPANEPASLSIKIQPAVQDIVFNDIIVNASLKIRGVAQGIDTFALNLPQSADSIYGEDTDFDLRKMVIKLRTGPGATYPLLTNPSYCGPMAFNAHFTGYGASQKPASQPFAATGCIGLPFTPALGIAMVDGATGGPAGPSDNIKRVALNVSAGLSASPDQAGIKNVLLTMPPPVTIDVQKLPFPCTLEQAAAKACPASAAVGNVSATSPLLKEPLTGTVYILKADPATPSIVLPRLLIALRGRINADIIATNSFVNVNQIVTRFDTLPDVPLSTFAININNFLTTRPDSCDYGPEDWNITSTLTGFNGSVAGQIIPVKFDCPRAFHSTADYDIKVKGKRSAMSIKVRPRTGTKLQKISLKLPDKLKFRRSYFYDRNIAKHVKVEARGKSLDPECFRRTSSKRFQVDDCITKATTIKITFRSGSLIASKSYKKKKSRFTMTAKDTRGKMRGIVVVG